MDPRYDIHQQSKLYREEALREARRRHLEEALRETRKRDSQQVKCEPRAERPGAFAALRRILSLLS